MNQRKIQHRLQEMLPYSLLPWVNNGITRFVDHGTVYQKLKISLDKIIKNKKPFSGVSVYLASG